MSVARTSVRRLEQGGIIETSNFLAFTIFPNSERVNMETTGVIWLVYMYHRFIIYGAGL